MCVPNVILMKRSKEKLDTLDEGEVKLLLFICFNDDNSEPLILISLHNPFLSVCCCIKLQGEPFRSIRELLSEVLCSRSSSEAVDVGAECHGEIQRSLQTPYT